jgi:HK97 family phage portal protein
MGMRFSLKNFLRKKPKQPEPRSGAFVFPVGPYGSNSWVSPRTDNPIIGEYMFLKSTTLSVCIRRRANAFASVPLKLMRKKKGGEAEEIESHPLKNLLNDVNPHDTGMDLKYKTSVFLDLTGDAYWLFEDGYREIYVPRSSQMRIVPDEKNFIKSYQYFPDSVDRSKFVEYPPERVLHFKYFNPSDPWYGAPPLLSGGTEIATDFYASEYQVKFFENGAMPVKLFQVEGMELMTDEQLKEFMEKWFLRYGGLDNFHKTGFVNQNVKELSSGPTMKDMEFNVLRKFERETICSMYDVPPMLAGIFEYANYANAREQRKSFWQEGNVPRMRQFEEVLNQLLIPRFNETSSDMFFEHDFSKIEPLQETSEEKTKNAVMVFNSGLGKRNEARAMIGLVAVPEEENTYKPQQQSLIDLLGGDGGGNLDNPRDGKVIVSPVVARKILEPQPVSTNGDHKISVGELVITHRLMGKAGLSPLPQEQKDDREDLRKGASTRLRRQEVLFAEDMVKFFNGQEKRLLKAFDEVLPPEKSNPKGMVKALTEKQIEGNGDDILNAIFDRVNEDGKLRKALIDRFRLVVEFAGQVTEADLGMVIDLSLTNPAVVAFFQLKQAKAIIINETTSEQIRERILRAIEEGWSTVQLRDDITNMFDAISEGRAMTIAQTETTGAYNFGTLETWKQSGLDIEKEWLSAHDDKVRDSHVAMDGKRARLDSTFPNGLMYPGDPSGQPEETINCRCSMLSARSED